MLIEAVILYCRYACNLYNSVLNVHAVYNTELLYVREVKSKK